MDAWKTVAVALVGYKVVVPFLVGVYKHFLRPGKKLKKYGEWAVVTGATDGIGKALAKEFVKAGLKVLLISRTESKLKEVAAELGAEYVAVDYSNFDDEKMAKVKKALDGKDIGILANNVGMSYPFTKYYHELTEKECSDLLALNLESTMLMTKLVLDFMVPKKRGAIVNTSSAAGTQISPLLAGYSGVKGGIVMFSKSLAAELKPLGIDVQVQTPLFVTTKLAKIKKSSLTVPTPSTYAKAAVNAIGYDVACSPYWAHALQLFLMDLLPSSIAIAIVSNMHHSIRKKGMKKQQAAASAAAAGDSKKAQ